jgi:hypothetical protein
MILSARHLLAVLLSLALFGLCQNRNEVAAQPKAPPVAVAPQAPTIAASSLTGAQRGTSVELTFTGTNLADPVGVWTSFPAKASFPPDMKNGTEPAKVRVKLEVPADAPIGFHTMRLATKHGISNAKVFCIDDLPQVAEVDTNRTKSTAQIVPVPCVVMGRTDAEVSDFFKFTAKAGQRLTFEVLGRRLGSAFDPIVILYDAKTGREMPGVYDDDAPGLQTDSRLTHTFKDAGDYLIEIRDTTFRGGADFFYRLRIGDFPAAIAAIPVTLKRGAKVRVTFAGPVVDGVPPVEVIAPTDPLKTVVYAAPKGPGGLSGWPVPIALNDADEITESEPNNDIAKANRINVPGGVTGRFLEKGDVDYFVFAAKKGTRYVIAAETFEINSPAEVYLILKNVKNGKEAELAKSAPTAPSARIEYVATEDGDLYVHAEHLNFAHGPNEIYHLTVKTPAPDFDIRLLLDRFDVHPGGTTLIPITSVIRRDYPGPIELSVAGNPGFSGTVTIPAGMPPAAPPPQPGQVIAWLPLTAKADLPMGAYELRVLAKGNANGKEFVKLADISDIVRTNMANLGFPPREMLTSMGVGVTDKPVFTLAAKAAAPEAIRGTPANVTVAATRVMGFVEDITLAAYGLPPNVTVAIKPIGKGTNDIQVQITAAPAAPTGKFKINFRGAAKSMGKDFAYYATPLELTILSPFDLKVEPSPISLLPGAKAKVKVTAVRRGGFAAAIDVELKNLPPNVTAPKTPIPMGQNEAMIELSAAPTTAAGDKADVNATGTAAGNVSASPNFTVRVEKAPKKEEPKKKDEPKKQEPQKKDEPKKK